MSAPILNALRPAVRPDDGNSSRDYLQAFVDAAAASAEPGARVLDAGAGDCRYAQPFAHAEYESADFQQVPGKVYAPVTYVCDLREIPVEDERFDLVLCTQVLEHLPDPRAVLTELRRVLRPGGRLWVSCPLFYAMHEEPYDFFRYTRYGLEHLLDEAGFAELRTEWLEGYFGTLAYQLKYAAANLPARLNGYDGLVAPFAYRAAVRGARPLLRRAARLLTGLDLAVRVTDRGMPKNFAAVAVRR